MVGETAPLIVILGPTAVGKTDLAIVLAEALNGEIISADSRQIYRYMDIGTAKPSPEQTARIRHHMSDFVDPDVSLSLAEYQEAALGAIGSIHKMGKVPFLVGGTGQYISAIVEGWHIPQVAPNPALRAQLEAEAEQVGLQAFHARLKHVDPDAAERIHPNNVRRVVRALEVYLETGQPISVQQRKVPPPFRILTLGLKLERETLYQRADTRVDTMIQMGLLEELRTLLDHGYQRRLPSMTGLGYAEFAAHLLDDLPFEEAVRRIKFNTHDFIRRQEIWFRGHDHGILWHNVDDIVHDTFIEKLTQWLQEQA